MEGDERLTPADVLAADGVLCKCGHPKRWHGPSVISPTWEDGKDWMTMCGHVPMLGTMSLRALRESCGCKGWQPDPDAKPRQCAHCEAPYGRK